MATRHIILGATIALLPSGTRAFLKNAGDGCSKDAECRSGNCNIVPCTNSAGRHSATSLAACGVALAASGGDRRLGLGLAGIAASISYADATGQCLYKIADRSLPNAKYEGL